MSALRQSFALNYRPANDSVKRVAAAIGRKGSQNVAKQLTATIAKFAQAMTVQASREVWRDTREAAPNATGDLRESIRATDVQPRGEEFQFTLEAPLDYASFSDTGTAEHTIYGAPLLVFLWPNNPDGAGSKAFFRKVTIPARAGSNWWGVNDENVLRRRFRDGLESGRIGPL